METNQFKFTTEEFYQLCLVIAVSQESISDTDNLLISIMKGGNHSKNETITLMSMVYGIPEDELRAMDGLEYFRLVKNFAKRIKWNEIMGEIIDLALGIMTENKEASVNQEQNPEQENKSEEKPDEIT